MQLVSTLRDHQVDQHHLYEGMTKGLVTLGCGAIPLPKPGLPFLKKDTQKQENLRETYTSGPTQEDSVSCKSETETPSPSQRWETGVEGQGMSWRKGPRGCELRAHQPNGAGHCHRAGVLSLRGLTLAYLGWNSFNDDRVK